MEKIMKILPLFLVVLLFSAAIIFSYMGWVALRGREEFNLFETTNNKGPAPGPSRSRTVLLGDGDQNFANLNEKKSPNPDDPENEGLPPGLISVNEDVLMDPDLERKIELLKMKVISKLRRHILNGAKVNGHINEYGVNFSKLKPKSQRVDRKEILCRIKKLTFKLLDQNSSPLFKGKNFPSESLFGIENPNKNRYESGNSDSDSSSGSKDSYSSEIKPEPLYKTCAVIPNSAAFDGARHGIDIDSHDFILRFNNAPTAGYEDDVGALTSLRIVNSQVVTKPRFGFPSSSFYAANSNSNNNMNSKDNDGSSKTNASEDSGIEIDNIMDSLWDATKKYLIWDPCSYSSSIEQWYTKPDFPIFDKYFKMTSQSARERNRFYIMDCRVIWRLWEILQEYSFVKIYGNPPTSGFIGIILSLQVCERVNIYEYIPSIRESTRCHYYGPKNESNPSCTYGSWHPVSAEKLFFLSISDGTDKSIFMDGVLTLPGVSQFNC